MNLNKIKSLLKKYFIFILLFVILLITILVDLLLPKNIAITIYIIILVLSLILRVILEIVSKLNQISINIDNKKDTLIKLYELFNLEESSNIVAINTRNEKLLNRAKKLFPGSRETKHKDVYSILLPKVTLKTILLFLEDNDPEQIIIHQFNKISDNKPKSVEHTLSICIDNKLLIRYSKNTFTKEEIVKIKDKLKSK